VAAARRLTQRSARQQARRFLVEGPQAVAAALELAAAGHADLVTELFVTPAARERHPDLLAVARDAAVSVVPVTPAVLASMAETVTPQGIVAVARFLDVGLEQVLAGQPRLVAVLAAVRDPGNAGTVLRCADAAGADAVVLTTDSVDVYNGKCVRASAGSLFHLPVVRSVEPTVAVTQLRQAGLRVLAAAGGGPTDLDDLADAGGLTGPTGWLFGNEAWGLSGRLTALADDVVRVPIHGRAESLNLATAAGVCLYASARAHRDHGR